MKDRQQVAKTNVETAISTIGADWTVAQLERTFDGYTLKLQKGLRTFHRTGIDEGVLEDEDSSGLGRLIEEARQ